MFSMDEGYYRELVSFMLRNKPGKEELSKEKMRLCKKHHLRAIPTDIQLLLQSTAKDLHLIRRYIVTKPQRSISGVAPVAIMSRPHKCPHGTCTYCPGGPLSPFGNVPQSYTGKEPTTRRAIRNRFDPYLQVMNRLEQYIVTGHVPEKVDLIIMGGTLPSLSVDYQEEFVAYSFKAMNDFSAIFFRNGDFDLDKFKEFFELPGEVEDKAREERLHAKLLAAKGKADLVDEQMRNELSDIRCIGLTIETKPDYAMVEQVEFMLRLGCTRVELGIQSTYEHILRKVNRGHGIKESVLATKILKDLGFKINYHMMPGLPDVSLKEDLESLKEIFRNPDYRPDMLKIYPCMVLKGTELYEDWKEGRFHPMNAKTAADLIAEFLPFVPEYCRMMRIQRDIPTYMTEAGVERTNLRQYVEKIQAEKGIACRDIRAREIGRSQLRDITGYGIRITEYDASGGKEFFIQAEKEDKLIGFCRLRFPSFYLRPEIAKKSALIRELHVYGTATALGEEGDIQHKGIGKELLVRAEETARQHGYDKLVVISGIGVREYYRRLGYSKEGPYMVKNL